MSNDPKQRSVDSDQLKAGLRDRRTLFGLEGGVVYTGTFHGQVCVVTNENYDDEGDSHATVRLFSDEEHRESYIVERGWTELRDMWRTMMRDA
jgi:hypothetical protein